MAEQQPKTASGRVNEKFSSIPGILRWVPLGCWVGVIVWSGVVGRLSFAAICALLLFGIAVSLFVPKLTKRIMHWHYDRNDSADGLSS